MVVMRAKMRVANVVGHLDGSESLSFSGVARADGYPEDGSDENNSFARWTPCAELNMLVQNPDLCGKFVINDEFYLDFTKASKP